MLSLRNQLLKNVIIHEQMSYIAHVKYMQLHSTAYQWWVSNWVIETRGQKVALWHAMCEHTGRINNCLALVCIKSPDWCPCCCHRSEGEPTSGHWNQGKWKWCRSGPLFWLWCHQQNKSGHSCPRRCLLTSGKRGTKEGKEKKNFVENMVDMQHLSLHDSVDRTRWLHVSSLPSHYSGHCKKHSHQ